MDFYSMLSIHYDDLFPPGAKQQAFLSRYLPRSGRVLDIGAGTGGYAAHMAASGAPVEALEIGSMYPLLAKRALERGFAALEMGMEDIAALEPEAYGLITCIGNTLVHLAGQAETAVFLKACRRLLQPEGVLILQIVNYDRVRLRGVTELPLITVPEKGLRLRRHYQLEEDAVRFRTQLESGEQCWCSETRLMALTRLQLCQLLEEAGFESYQVNGDFSEAPWTPDSPALVVTAVR